MHFLLDTNILSDLIRNPKGRVAKRVRQVGEANICTSIIAACEVRFGAAKRNSARLELQVEAVLKAMNVLPFENPADTTYAAVRTNLEKLGLPIGGNDLLIAAHAITLGCTLITANEREFARVHGLKCENWLLP